MGRLKTGPLSGGDVDLLLPTGLLAVSAFLRMGSREFAPATVTLNLGSDKRRGQC